MKTPFDDMFDYNHDGNLDWLEKGARDAFIMSIIDEEKKKRTMSVKKAHCLHQRENGGGDNG